MAATFRKLTFAEDLQKLKKSFVNLFPTSAQMLNVLNLKIQKRVSSDSQIEFFIFENETHSDINSETIDHPFVVCTQRPNIHSLYCILILAPPNPTKEMIKAFENLVEWNKVRLFGAVNQSFFENHLKSLCLKHGNLGLNNRSDGIPCESYIMDPEFALKYEGIKITDSIQVKHLSTEDSEEIVRNYKFSQPHSQLQVEEAIRNITSAGVYVNSELASSVLLSPAGLITMLFTDEKHRRKGYGNIALQALSKYIAEMGLYPMVECEIWHKTSRDLLIRCGFKLNGFTNWVHFKQ